MVLRGSVLNPKPADLLTHAVVVRDTHGNTALRNADDATVDGDITHQRFLKVIACSLLVSLCPLCVLRTASTVTELDAQRNLWMQCSAFSALHMREAVFARPIWWRL